MTNITNTEFLIGFAIGKLLAGALSTSPLFRGIALTIAAASMSIGYVHAGMAGILALAEHVRAAVMTRPDFAKGVAMGAASAVVFFGIRRKRVKM